MVRDISQSKFAQAEREKFIRELENKQRAGAFYVHRVA